MESPACRRCDVNAVKYFPIPLLMLLSACIFEEDDGVCTGFSKPLDTTYCYSRHAEQQCQSYNTQAMNGASWHWYEGQSCADRGLREGEN